MYDAKLTLERETSFNHMKSGSAQQPKRLEMSERDRSPPSHLCVAACFFCAALLIVHGRCQDNQNPPPTDEAEASALRKLFQRWRIQLPQWNNSLDPCRGPALDNTPFEDDGVNSFIKCVCDYANNTCHITQLRATLRDIHGTIPEELINLPHIFNLNLSRNYFTGPLPAFLGNLSRLEYLNLFMNSFSGVIPKELGSLNNLKSLALGSNSFSGSLPAELGNLLNLEQLYIESCEFSGEIPSTFAQLRNLIILWASGNNFTGKIPSFLGQLTNLTNLRLQGNSLDGPIPSSFANLANLRELKIGELTNGSSSLDFIREMKNKTTLRILILRNCKLIDTIPSAFKEYTNLEFLDLSFNNLNGLLSDSLFSSSSLHSLFLGNNELSGALPNLKSLQLLVIDLSYNSLTGNFPSWVNNRSLQLNLVANNFVQDVSNNSVLPAGLRCLQRDFPCHRVPSRWSSFAINCGSGKSVTSSDNTVYDVDNANLSTSYYMSDMERWAVSSVGLFLDAADATHIREVSSPISGTSNSVLFQTARLSPSSLRYYGLGLENGNYQVKLEFAETSFSESPSWSSIAERIFDIYIQGDLKIKDFNIRREAGQTSFKAVERVFTAEVTENFLEIHFFWAGKGTCCVPTAGTYGPSVSGISVTRNINKKRRRLGFVVGITVGIAGLSIFLVSFGVFLCKRKEQELEKDLLGLETKPYTFSFSELRTATDNFSPANKLGEGGFGPVFKGKLSDGRLVAVKQLSVGSKQGKEQFVAEIATISSVQHRNLVQLYGCCFKGEGRLLVYEYLENKSLDQALFGKSSLQLNWSARYDICLNTARGLAHLHLESRIRIVHRDIKASNILLDGKLNPKISDFGLAKLFDDNKTHISTRIAGTFEYLAPEYYFQGHLTEKADVFGFGIVVLEILSGRQNTDASLREEEAHLLKWAWLLYENNSEMKIMDPTLSSYNEEEAIRIFRVALLCTQGSPVLRPSMLEVVKMLAGDIKSWEISSRTIYLTDWQHKEMHQSFENDGLPTSALLESDVNRSYSGWSGIEVASSSSANQPMLHQAM